MLERLLCYVTSYSLIVLLTATSTVHAFQSEEHYAVGDRTYLYDDKSQNLVVANDYKFSIDQRYNASFGLVVAAPDLWVVFGVPVSEQPTAIERQAAFTNSARIILDHPDEARDYEELMISHLQAIEQGRKVGKQASEVFREQATVWDAEKIAASSDRILRALAGEQDEDHVSDNAHESYATGHELATATAASGNLETAYLYEAYALHYLTDAFAAGHMRVSRENMRHSFGNTLASLALGVEHDFDNRCGLNASTYGAPGTYSSYYGDNRMLDDVNGPAFSKMLSLVNQSLAQVYTSYLEKDDRADYQAILQGMPNISSSYETPRNYFTVWDTTNPTQLSYNNEYLSKDPDLRNESDYKLITSASDLLLKAAALDHELAGAHCP